MLNGVCPLSKILPTFPGVNRQHQDEWNASENQMKSTQSFTLYFKF